MVEVIVMANIVWCKVLAVNIVVMVVVVDGRCRCRSSSDDHSLVTLVDVLVVAGVIVRDTVICGGQGRGTIIWPLGWLRSWS